MKKSVYNGIGIVLLTIGVLIILSNGISLTGSVIGGPLSSLSNTLVGIVFILISMVFMVGVRKQEKMNLVDILNREISAGDRPACEILMDANFVKYLHDIGYTLSKRELGNYRAEIVDRVNDELKHRSQQTRQPLVSNETLNMLSSAGVEVWTQNRSRYRRDEKLEAQIFEYWEDFTPQGKMYKNKNKPHDSYEAKKFRTSGDLEMLAYAVQKRGYTVILTDNYSEIGKMAEKINDEKKNMKIIVLGTKDVFR